MKALTSKALTVWGPYASSNGQWIAKNVLGGFFAAPIEALPEVSVTDVVCQSPPFAFQEIVC